MNFLTVIYAVLIFGGMVFLHEFGHYLFARIFHVTIQEFAIGMGPRLVKRTSKKTGITYSIRLFLIGGFVSMDGEDSESDNPNAFCKKPAWQRLIITGAGACMNIITGVVLSLCMVLSSSLLGTTIVARFPDGESAASYQSGLRPGDEIRYVGNTRVHTDTELTYEITRQGTEPLRFRVLRDGQEQTITVTFSTEEEKGVSYGVRDFQVYGVEKTVGGVLRYTWYQSRSSVKMIWQSLGDLITGRYGIEAVSGPVGVTGVIGQAASVSATSLLYLCALISMNLGIFNLLPIPALDGGRMFFQLIEIVRRKPVDPKHEGYVHAVGMVVLLAFMALITFKDIVSLFR